MHKPRRYPPPLWSNSAHQPQEARLSLSNCCWKGPPALSVEVPHSLCTNGCCSGSHTLTGWGWDERVVRLLFILSHILEDMNLPSTSKWTLLMDYSNTFNSISRTCMFEEVKDRISTLASWVESCYGLQPLLHFGDHTILSRCDMQQGNLLGPLLFFLTLHPIVEEINREVLD